MTSAAEHSFRINLRVMRAFHLYPDEKKTRFYKIQAYVMHFLFVVPAPMFGILYILLDDDLNMERVNYNAAFLAQATSFTTKLLPFIYDGGRIKKCVQFFQSSFLTGIRANQQNIMDDCSKVCRRNTYIFLTFCCGAVTSWATKPFLWEGRNFPVDIWLPFDPTTKFEIYCCIYIFLCIGVYFSTVATGVIDPLIAGLAYHATSQIKILKDNLQHLKEYTEEDHTGFEKSETVYSKIKRSIDHHNDILNFIKEYEECFSPVVISQIGASVFVICFCCLQLSKIDTVGYYFLQLISYFSVILAEIYFYCYYGTTLIEESNTITNAIYMSDWYNFDVKSKKALITIMERSQKPIVITVGNVLELSLQTFTVILKRSYSLIAVLKNYQ